MYMLEHGLLSPNTWVPKSPVGRLGLLGFLGWHLGPEVELWKVGRPKPPSDQTQLGHSATPQVTRRQEGWTGAGLEAGRARPRLESGGGREDTRPRRRLGGGREGARRGGSSESRGREGSRARRSAAASRAEEAGARESAAFTPTAWCSRLLTVLILSSPARQRQLSSWPSLALAGHFSVLSS